MRRCLGWAVWCLGGILVGTSAAAASSPAEATVPAAASIDFARDVYPLLQRACLECHGAKLQEAGLRLDDREEALASGTLAAGDPGASELLRRIRLPRGAEGVMPAVGEPLAAEQVELLERWIAGGASWPEDFKDPGHWAYRGPERPVPPEVAEASWVRTPLDRFVLRRLEAAGWQPSPPARPEKRLRRLYLDLIGLPPSPQEVAAFLADPSPRRWEARVDELLARPQFGERWARPWLDLARYADSHGFQRDNLREIWAYRDWVIQALNDDMPFDQFTIEQLAGDLLPDPTESQRIATGFHRCAPTNVEAGSLPEETRVEQLIDRVNTTGAVWLGTTLECCQCHDHKYDPFSMKEYYQLLAYFNSTAREADRTDPQKPSSIQFQGPSMPLSDPDRAAHRAAVQRDLEAAQQARQTRRSRLADGLAKWAADWSARLENAPQTHLLEVIDFASQGAHDRWQRLDDGSILLLSDSPPAKDVYDVRVRLPGQTITALRLDVLRDERLPGKGPGRGDPQKTNFVLHEFIAEPDPAGERLAFQNATASFSQARFDVGGAVDGDRSTGWAIAPQFDREHWAQFVLAEPLVASPGAELRIRLVQQWGKARTIGRLRLSAISGEVGLEAFPDPLRKLVKQPADRWSKEERKQLLDHRVGQDPQIQEIDRRIAGLNKQRDALDPDTTLVMVELDKPRPTRLFMRGDYRNPGETVQPATPEILPAGGGGKPNRLQLARWLVSRDNPLTARVTVNRWWAELFGEGLVATPEDFGVKGDRPTHPELLDWLAVELMEQGWSMKRLLKTIVMSATYQQRSAATPEQLVRDDRNRWLARGPRFRLGAEMIRDNALAVSGLLDRQAFGPPVRPYQPPGIWSKVGGTAYQYAVTPGGGKHRRGVYVVLKRGSPYPSFINFDATARLTCTVERSRTNTPLQALTLLNDRVYVEAAEALAQRVLRERASASRAEQLAYAFQLCTARPPRPGELQALRQLWEARFADQANQQTSADHDARRHAAWQSVATVLLNLHETVTKD